MKKTFPLAAVLSITTGCLFCEIGGVYEILNHMTGENLYTHQLPRASRQCAPSLLEQFPRLAAEDVASQAEAFAHSLHGATDGFSLVEKWLSEKSAVWGAEFDVEPLPADAYMPMDPISELMAMRSDKPEGGARA